MSLKTDIIFVKALQSCPGLMETLAAHNVYNTAIGLPDKDLDNVSLPYIIVRYMGMQNQDETKDNDFEGDTDVVNISLTICARTREQLGDLAETARLIIREYFIAHSGDESDSYFDFIPLSMVPSAGGVFYDAEKPCYWQELNYQCETNP